MAEIRSTLDMVMERAARMAAQAKDQATDDTVMKEGMRMAAEYMKRDDVNLVAEVAKQESAKQTTFTKGLFETLLRNIVLPREEFQIEEGEKALDAINELSEGAAGDVCSELHQLLNQYTQHKEQVQNQLEDAIKSQLQQKLAEQGGQLSDDIAINPSMHPQYREELSRMLGNLNDQYNQAFDQRKEMIRQRLFSL